MNRQTIIAFLIILLLLLCACTSPHRIDGWYAVADAPYNSIDDKPLATVNDFADVAIVRNSLIIDGDTVDILLIQGHVKPEIRQLWADATERLIGHRLGFDYRDSVISAPQINARIESGSFQITSSDTTLIKSVYLSIRQQINQQ